VTTDAPLAGLFDPNDPTQPEVIRRIMKAINADVATNQFPAPHTVPALLMQWDVGRGIIRLGFCKHAELEPHIAYLRICDLQVTLAQLELQAARHAAMSNPKLYELGEVIGGKPPRRMLELDS
jgi:hypothetical protein